jgi:hypothetical protein
MTFALLIARGSSLIATASTFFFAIAEKALS